MRAARADLKPALLVAPEIAPARHHPPRASTGICLSAKHQQRLSKGALGQVAARLFGAEERKASGGARSALQPLTRRRLSERSDEGAQ